MDAIKEEQFYQKIVYDIWKEKLPNTEFSIDDNFFDYICYWNEKYYRNGFCDGVDLIIGCIDK